jgi:hypothetical protein
MRGVERAFRALGRLSWTALIVNIDVQGRREAVDYVKKRKWCT